MLHASAAKATGKASALSILILNGRALTVIPCHNRKLPNPHQRDFWWSPSGYRAKPASSKIGRLNYLDDRQKSAIKFWCSRPSRQASFRRSNDPEYQYDYGHGVRPRNSWGNSVKRFSSNDEWANDRKRYKQAYEEWDKELQPRQEELSRRFEALRRKFDEDPFTVLFGRTIERGVFNPWNLMGRNVASKNSTKNSATPAATSSSEEQLQRERRPVSNGDGIKQSSMSNAKHSHSPDRDAAKTSYPQDSNESFREYDIDPITLKKVPRRPVSTSTTTKDSGISVTEVEMPMKAPSVSPPNQEAQETHKPRKSSGPSGGAFWEYLLQNTRLHQFDTIVLRANSSLSKSGPSRIETSLDRRARIGEAEPRLKDKLRLSLHCQKGENKIEGIDSLGASDVRASSDLAGKTRSESSTEKLERRQKLELLYKIRDLESRVISLQLDIELLGDKVSSKVKKLMTEREHKNRIGVDKVSTEQVKKLITEKEQKKRMAAKQVLAEEVRLQNAAMDAIEHHRIPPSTQSQKLPILPGEGDMSANVHEFASRDRWYKKRAPHAADWERQNTDCYQQQSKDRELVREIRGIYEDVYGTIDTKHRQNASDSTLRDTEDTTGREPDQKRLGEPVGASTASVSAEPTSPHSSENLSQRLEQRRQDGNQEIWARKLEEEEQKLHEEWHETKDLIHTVLIQLNQLANSPRLRPQDSSKESHKTETASTAYQAQVDRDAGFCLDRRPSISPSTPSVTETPFMPAPSVYKVLVYDYSTKKVTIANTTSTNPAADETPLSVSQILPRLSHPVPFVAHFPALQSAGYEIVSGKGGVLVFKKVREAEPVTPELNVPLRSGPAKAGPVNPIDGTTTQTGNFASPTGFVNHDVVYPLPSEDVSSSRHSSGLSSREKVRREEEVFSGSPRRQWQSSERAGREGKPGSRIWKVGRRVLWVGVWTAGCCYAAGVVSEFFRTGGSTGLGPQGF